MHATFRFVDLDRVVLGGIVPTLGALHLEAIDTLAAAFSIDRREIGLLNFCTSHYTHQPRRSRFTELGNQE